MEWLVSRTLRVDVAEKCSLSLISPTPTSKVVGKPVAMEDSGFNQANDVMSQGWGPWIRAVLGQLELTALRITLFYVILGMTALLLSDVLLPQYLNDPFLSQAQALKGGIEILLTGGFIYVIVRRSRRQIHQATEQVERQRDELSLLHRVFRHNLRNTLNVIRGHSELAKERAEAEQMEERCKEIYGSSERILEYTEQARRIRKVTDGDGSAERIDLATMVDDILTDHPLVTDEVTVRTAVPEGIEVEANPMLTEAIRELVTNAIKHNDASTPTLSIELDGEAGSSEKVGLRIQDNGPGLPPSEIESLRRERESQVLHATGMGLWFVDWVATHSGGELRVLSADDTGTDVCVHLPKAMRPPVEIPVPTTFSGVAAD
jgi:two-component system OmpR family sensor kinase